jgi:hypothetical protein
MRSLKSVSPVQAYPRKYSFSEKRGGEIYCGLYIESFKTISTLFKEIAIQLNASLQHSKATF